MSRRLQKHVILPIHRSPTFHAFFMPKGFKSERLVERSVDNAQLRGLIHSSIEMRAELFEIFESMICGDFPPRGVAVVAAADLVLELSGTSSLLAQYLEVNSLRAMHHQQIHMLLLAVWHATCSSHEAVEAVNGSMYPSSKGASSALDSDRSMASSILKCFREPSEADELSVAVSTLFEFTQDALSARINQTTGAEAQEVIELIQGFNAAAVLAARIVGRIVNKPVCDAMIRALIHDYRECLPLGPTWNQPFLDFAGSTVGKTSASARLDPRI